MAISVGWVGNISGVLKPFTVYIDTGISFPDAWNEVSSVAYIANATISTGDFWPAGALATRRRRSLLAMD